ncbi:MAG: type IV toxin-antitoxin system AbiEi family antitoxin domain-containing protein [Candidatus Nanopelagicales bacterium]
MPKEQVRVRLNAAVHAGRLFTPSRGLWVAIPPKYRTWGAPPAVEFVDQLMTHLEREYYVGWLSAAEIHGAAHQRPQALQVAVDRPVEDRSFGRSHLRFTRQSGVGELPRQRHNVESGHVWVSTPELTAVDLVDRPELGGGLSNVATVLFELAETAELDPVHLAKLARTLSATAVRRVGYLLDLVQAPVDTTALAEAMRATPLPRPALLDPRHPRKGTIDPRWDIVINTEVEPDL